MAGVTWWNFYFRLFPGSIRSPQVVEFLSHRLGHHIPGKLLVVWDGLKSHRGRLVWDFVRQQRGRIWLEFSTRLDSGIESGGVSVVALEAAEFPNFCPESFGELSH